MVVPDVMKSERKVLPNPNVIQTQVLGYIDVQKLDERQDIQGLNQD